MTTAASTPTDKLPDSTAMGTLHLRVKDMAAMLDFYTRGVGLAPVDEHAGVLTLGLRGRPVVALHESPDLRPATKRDAGLFHTAVLFDSEAVLAASMVRMLTHFDANYSGAGDHAVSQAFYFADPEGNGVELYADRPRDQWQWRNGEVHMTTLYIDPLEFIRTHLAVDLDAARTSQDLSGSIGHVHLQVGDVATAREFYVEVLGFDQTARLGNQALFVSAGGYHHHMAMNTWNSSGAGTRARTLGLGQVDITLPSRAELDAVSDRLRSRRIAVADTGQAIVVPDPWGNTLRLSIPA